MEKHYDESLVGSLALIFSLITFVIALGPWARPYRLSSIAAVHARFGKLAARGIWCFIAITSLVSGMAILNGVRPSYAMPAKTTEQVR